MQRRDAERMKCFYGSAMTSPRDNHEMIEATQVGAELGAEPMKLTRAQLMMVIRQRIEELTNEIEGALKGLGFTGPLSALRGELRRRIGTPRLRSVEQRAFLVFQLAQILGWPPQELHRLGEGGWATLVDEIEMFTALDRRRTFHLAYEHRFTCQALDALALHARARRPEPAAPRFQAVFCIDEREESMRRHLEELAPDAATFGIAGFYFLDMYYRGAEDAHFVPLCPAVRRCSRWPCAASRVSKIKCVR